MKTATAGASLGPERLPWPPDRARQRSVLAAAAGPAATLRRFTLPNPVLRRSCAAATDAQRSGPSHSAPVSAACAATAVATSAAWQRTGFVSNRQRQRQRRLRLEHIMGGRDPPLTVTCLPAPTGCAAPCRTWARKRSAIEAPATTVLSYRKTANSSPPSRPNRSRGAHRQQQHSRYVTQHLVACCVPVAIIDRFEMIDVEHDQGRW